MLSVCWILAVFISGCSGDGDPGQPGPDPGSSGDIFFSVSLLDAPSPGYDVTAAEVVLNSTSKNGPITILLTLDGDHARGLASDLEAGSYEITTNIRHGQPVLTRSTLLHTVTEGTLDTLSINDLDWEDLFPELPRNVLFVGNSLTNYNGGLGNHMAGFVAGCALGLDVGTSQMAPGGYTLDDHWNDDSLATPDSVSSGIYDWIVLQGSPANMINNPSNFRYYCDYFISHASLAGAHPALFIPPSYQDFPQYEETLVEICEARGNHYPVSMIPINQAWYHVLNDRPSLALFHTDGSHPSFLGTYLNMCVIYSALFQSSPVGCDYVYNEEISATDRLYLQESAWAVTSTYLGWDF